MILDALYCSTWRGTVPLVPKRYARACCHQTGVVGNLQLHYTSVEKQYGNDASNDSCNAENFQNKLVLLLLWFSVWGRGGGASSPCPVISNPSNASDIVSV